MHLQTHIRVYGVIVEFKTNDKSMYAEWTKEFGQYTDHTADAPDGRITVLVKDKMSFEVPEHAVRDSIVFPSASVYVYKGQIFLLEREKYFIILDPENFESKIYVKLKSSVFEKVRFITKRFLIGSLENKKIFSIHGSAVCKGSGTIVFCGVSGSGKTTCMLSMLEKGYRMVADDIVLMDGDSILPFFLRSMIHKDTLKRFPSLASGIDNGSTWVAEADGWWLNMSDVYRVQQEPAFPKAIFHTHVWNSTSSSCEKIEPSKLLPSLMKNYMMEAGAFFQPNSGQVKRAFAAYLKIIEKSNCYNLYVGTDSNKLYKTIKDVVG
jgi:hypothetical protein